MRFFIIVALVGCATIHEPVNEKPPVVTYWGTARGAEIIVKAQDVHPYDLAQTAMDKDMPVSLQKTDEFVGFNAGYSYVMGPGLGGYASADVISTQNGWYVPTGQGSSLPKLGTPVVVPETDIVPCPKGRVRTTAAQQAACAEQNSSLIITHLKQENR